MVRYIDEVEILNQLSLNLALFPSRTSGMSFHYNYHDIHLYSLNEKTSYRESTDNHYAARCVYFLSKAPAKFEINAII